MRARKGCIYEEYTAKRYIRNVGLVKDRRFVAEIMVNRKRFRSTNYRSCENWLKRMLELYPYYELHKG